MTIKSPKRTPIHRPHGSPHEDMAREEMLHSLLDGRARWPDGSLRVHVPEISVPVKRKITLAGQGA